MQIPSNKILSPLGLSISLLLLNQPSMANSLSTLEHACFDTVSQRLHLPKINDANTSENYSLSLDLVALQPVTFDLDLESVGTIDTSTTTNATYTSETGVLTAPAVLIGQDWGQVELQQSYSLENIRFEMTQLSAGQAPDAQTVIGNCDSVPRFIIETGQKLSYDDNGNEITAQIGDDFYGQDIQYQSVSFSFTDNSDGTVADNNTGLTWQQIPSAEKYTWQAAQDYCANLEYADHDDWRTPSLKELISIEDFEQGWPYIDTDYFSFGDESIGKHLQFWSNNDYKVGTTHGGSPTAFGLNYGTGHIKGYPTGDGGGELPPLEQSGAPVGTENTEATSENSPPPQESDAPAGVGDTENSSENNPPPPNGEAPTNGNVAAKFVRCVSGEDYGINRFVDNGDGTVSDYGTGLMWMKDDSVQGKDWVDALAYAENLEYAGYDDWHLPNVKELQSIVDYSGVYPAINPDYFNITDEDAYFWSSTSAYFSNVSEEQQKRYWAWYVAFGYAVDNNGEDSHGAGAIRYDTKVEGGPVGEDTERVYNYARAVRNISSQ
ncbi:DUF1566 domain-containing protein [Candidatus Albibeggiatoa sp. nov. BB20]|uniref:Lcl C-terminal domain-containing protein n=1 Tax=Candidatus Albibeggiatoa sp. nov. BB20 TaxID=3162723 RepID=UPI0033659707